MDEGVIQAIALLCHEVNKAYCESIGDTSQPDWDEAPEWQRQSAANGVRFHLASPDATPEDSHANWVNEKLGQGWKVGPVKDPEAKEHPCIVPYKDLPLEQRVKDALFIAIVHTMQRII